MIRAATVADAPEIVRLAGVMFASIGHDIDAPGWRAAGEESVRTRLGGDLAVFVADHPDRPGRLVATAAGTITARLPGPRNPSGRAGYIQWVATDPDWRRRGLARQIMDALLGWFDTAGVRVLDLHATADGEPLYRSLGFTEGAHPALRRFYPVTPQA